MIVRLVGLCVCGVGAYALLRGWPEGLPVLLRACLAVLLLAGGLGWWSVRKKEDDVPAAKGVGKPGWRDMLVVGTAFLALECGFLWLLSAAPAPLEEMALVLEEKLRPEAAAEREEGERGSAVSGNWLWENGTRRELPRRTNLKPSAKPEVFVKLRMEEDAEALLKRKVYVRAFALGEFADSTWSMNEGQDEEILADEDGWVRFDEMDGREILHEVFHGKDVGGQDLLTTLQGVRAVRLPEILVAADGMNFLPDVAGEMGFRYLASSVSVSLDDLKGVMLEAKGEGGGDRVAELARRVAGDGTVLEKLLRIRDFLRENYSYSLVTENPHDLEPLENFLFGEKRGHCEFFATAGALMSREIGVESRVAYGWAGGSYFKDDMMFAFVAREAHAWVELKLEGYGWVVMDPTPPMVPGGEGVPRIAEAGDELPVLMEELLYGEYARAGDSHVERIALILMGGFGGLALVMFFLKRSVSEGGKSGRMIRGKGKGGYMEAWEKACAERAVRRKKGDTLKVQISRVAPVPDFSEELLAYHYGIHYEGRLAEPETERNLIRRMREWGQTDVS